MRQARHRQKPYHMNIISLEEFGLYSEGNGMFGFALEKDHLEPVRQMD